MGTYEDGPPVGRRQLGQMPVLEGTTLVQHCEQTIISMGVESASIGPLPSRAVTAICAAESACAVVRYPLGSVPAEELDADSRRERTPHLGPAPHPHPGRIGGERLERPPISGGCLAPLACIPRLRCLAPTDQSNMERQHEVTRHEELRVKEPQVETLPT